MRLESKVAMVTGAGRGIGRATSILFAANGAKLVLADVDIGPAEEVAGEIESAGGEAVAVAGSVTDRGDVQRMVALATDSYGRLDILINNAGMNLDGLVVKIKDDDVRLMDDEQWQRVLDVNLKGTFLCAQAAAVPMMRQKSGRIVNTSSIGALGNVGQANYSAAKSGVIGLTKTLALEWARHGIAVNCVAPGATSTRMTEGIPEKILEGILSKIPLHRLAEPEEIAAAHLFFASADSSYVTGQILFVDGGISVGI